MSNIFHGTSIAYFQVPQSVIVLRLLSVLPLCALRMYIALLYKAQRFSRPDLKMTNHDFATHGVSANSVRHGRMALSKHGLIQFEEGNDSRYILCDPETKQSISPRKSQPHVGNEACCPEQGRISAPARSNKTLIALLSPEERKHYFESRLQGRKRPTTGGFMTICPFHDDGQPSLKVDVEKGIWFCHGCKSKGGMVGLEARIAGCDNKTAFQRIVDLLGRRDLIGSAAQSTAEHSYDYVDERGGLLFQVRRYRGKKFKVFRRDSEEWKLGIGDARRVLYRLPEVIEARIVLVNEGEADADRCKKTFPEGEIAATTNAFGAGAWREEYSPFLRDKLVLILPDNDDVGRQHAEAVAHSVSKYAREVRIVKLPDLPKGGDVSDYLDLHSREYLDAGSAKLRTVETRIIGEAVVYIAILAYLPRQVLRLQLAASAFQCRLSSMFDESLEYQCHC
jgi:5S rRNA maturation endonuclease (ribonuclease M5)